VLTSPANVSRVWASVFGLALSFTLLGCAEGVEPAPLAQRDGATALGEAGKASNVTSGSGGSDSVAGAGGSAGTGSAAGSTGSAGTDSVDSSVTDPEGGADAQSAVDAAEEIAIRPDTGSTDARSADASRLGPDITGSGTIIALDPAPIGGGNKNLEVIRDGVTPPVGSTDSALQYDSFHNDPQRAEDWIGYSFASSTTFVRVVFQDGKRFIDGGWFDTLKLQVRQANVWVDVPGVSTSPTYGAMSSPNFTTYQLDFAPISGDAIRIDGVPGGSMKFISVGELRVFREAP